MKDERLQALGAVPVNPFDLSGLPDYVAGSDAWSAVRRTAEAQDRAERIRQGMVMLAQVVADNPAQFAGILAAEFVASQILVNLVRPRTWLQALACGVVMAFGAPMALSWAHDKGLVDFTIRDAHGCRHSLRSLREEMRGEDEQMGGQVPADGDSGGAACPGAGADPEG